MAELTYDEISKILRADFETGKLYWLPRPLDMFPDERSGKIWNTRYAGKEACTTKPLTYRKVRIYGKTYRSHRVIWLLLTGEWPNGHIDHINGNRSDNRIHNLRTVSIAENNKNMARRSSNMSGVVGVNWEGDRGVWLARININGRTKNLGRFRDLKSAANARKVAEKKYGFHENHGRS